LPGPASWKVAAKMKKGRFCFTGGIGSVTVCDHPTPDSHVKRLDSHVKGLYASTR